MLGQPVPVERDLVPEFLLSGILEKACERMIVCLVEKLDALALPAGIEKVLESLDDFAPVELGLIQEGTRQADGELDIGVFFDKRSQCPDCGEVSERRLFGKDFPVSFIPQELVPFGMEQEGLMQLEIEDDGQHWLLILKSHRTVDWCEALPQWLSPRPAVSFRASSEKSPPTATPSLGKNWG